MPSAPEIKKRLRQEQRFILAVRTALALTVTPDNPLPELIGLFGFEATMEFILVFGGAKFEVPTAAQVVRPFNVAGAALAVFSKELTVEQAARKFGVGVIDIQKTMGQLEEEHRLQTQVEQAEDEMTDEIREQQETVDYQ